MYYFFFKTKYSSNKFHDDQEHLFMFLLECMECFKRCSILVTWHYFLLVLESCVEHLVMLERKHSYEKSIQLKSIKIVRQRRKSSKVLFFLFDFSDTICLFVFCSFDCFVFLFSFKHTHARTFRKIS